MGVSRGSGLLQRNSVNRPAPGGGTCSEISERSTSCLECWRLTGQAIDATACRQAQPIGRASAAQLFGAGPLSRKPRIGQNRKQPNSGEDSTSSPPRCCIVALRSCRCEQPDRQDTGELPPPRRPCHLSPTAW